MSEQELKIFSGNSNLPLAREICNYLGAKLGQASINRFSDGEINIQIDENVRGCDVFLLQSTHPPADNILEMLLMMDALRRASAGGITAVIPYYGYARQERKVAPRTPISARLVADLLEVSGATRIVGLDLHAGQIQGFFNVPFDHLFAMPVFLEYLEPYNGDLVVVSPDAGGAERARAYAKRLNASIALIDKRRSEANVSEVMHIIGEVKDKACVILDDIIDTAGTMTSAAQALKDAGAKKVMGCCTHPVLSGPAIERIDASPIEELIVTNSIPLHKGAQASDKIKVVSVADILGEAIKRVHDYDSVSSLFV